MLDNKEEHVAVIAHEDSRIFVGCVHQSEVLMAFNRALIEAQAEERGDPRQTATPF